MGEAIGRVIGFLLVGIFELIVGGIGAIFRTVKTNNANARLVANAKRSDGVIMRTPPIIPHEARFEHTHICAGSGHGKTQLLQKMILEDMQALKDGKGSLVVIDSQGDLINKISHLADMRDLRDKLILIDPNNIEYPPALNLFDFGLERLETYNALERERLLNGAVGSGRCATPVLSCCAAQPDCRRRVRPDAVARLSLALNTSPAPEGLSVALYLSAMATDVGKGINIFRRGADGKWRVAIDGWSSDTPPAD